MNQILTCTSLPAFEIAEELLKDPKLRHLDCKILRQQIDFFMLLAHSRAELLPHPCRCLAAAAILTALRLQAIPAPTPSGSWMPSQLLCEGTRSCATWMWAVVQAGGPDELGPPGPA